MYFDENCFLADSEQEAIQVFSEKCGCRVLPIVYPTSVPCVYCISEHGELFSIHKKVMAKKYMGYGPISNYYSHGNRSTICYNFEVAKGRYKFFYAEKLVYCTFVVGEWDEDMQVACKDGNRLNIRLDNLEQYKETIPPEWNERMESQSTLYKRYFNHVAGIVERSCGVSEQDAKDITQDTFLWMIKFKDFDKLASVLGCWVKWAKMWSTTYYHRNQRFDNLDDYAESIGAQSAPCEINLFALIKNEKHRNMMWLYMNGCMQKEIAEIYGTTEVSVRGMLHEEIVRLRKYIGKREIEFLRQ